MKKISVIFLVFSFISFRLIAQNSIFNCSYSTNNGDLNCNLLDYSSSLQDIKIEKQVKKILLEVGLPQNFILKKCTNLHNAAAYTSMDGTRYIVIDHSWIGSLGNSDWLKLSILAHEIGHHLAGHTLKSNSSLSQLRNNELEADKFSGHILKQLGASLSDAQYAINSLLKNDYEDVNSTHPSKSKRLNAIYEGFVTDSDITKSYLNEKSCEEYLNEAYSYYNLSLKEQTILSYSKALEINPYCAEALNNIGKLYNDLYKPDIALKYLFRCLKIQNDWIVKNNIGLSYLLLGKINESISIFNAIIKSNISNEANGFAYYNRGQAYAKANYWKNACSDWYQGNYYGHPAAKENFLKYCR